MKILLWFLNTMILKDYSFSKCWVWLGVDMMAIETDLTGQKVET